MTHPAPKNAWNDTVSNTLTLFIVAGLLALIALCFSGCVTYNNTRYANNNVEHFEPDSRGVAAQGNAAGNAASFSDTAAVTLPSGSTGQTGAGDGDRQVALFANSHSDRASDVDAAAAFQAMRGTKNSTGSLTSPQALDTSTADAASTTSPTVTPTTTVTTPVLSGDAVQLPLQGSSTGAQTQGSGASGDNASTLDQQGRSRPGSPASSSPAAPTPGGD